MAKYYVNIDGNELGLEVNHKEGHTTIHQVEGHQVEGETTSPEISVDFAAVHSNIDTGEGLYSLIADGKSFQVHVERTEDGTRMVIGRHRIDLQVLTEREWRLKKVAPREAQHGGILIVKAPMPGLVKGVLVAEGENVHSGQRLVVLEAMKMENDIAAPQAGKVTVVHVVQGATVEGGKPLVTIDGN